MKLDVVTVSLVSAFALLRFWRLALLILCGRYGSLFRFNFWQIEFGANVIYDELRDLITVFRFEKLDHLWVTGRMIHSDLGAL